MPCQGKHREKLTKDKDEAQQFLRLQEASKHKLSANIKTQNRDMATNGGAEYINVDVKEHLSNQSVEASHGKFDNQFYGNNRCSIIVIIYHPMKSRNANTVMTKVDGSIQSVKYGSIKSSL